MVRTAGALVAAPLSLVLLVLGEAFCDYGIIPCVRDVRLMRYGIICLMLKGWIMDTGRLGVG